MWNMGENPMNETAQCSERQDPVGTFVGRKDAPTRRVGSFTVGIALVAAGVVILIKLFYPAFDFSFACKFSPLILIGLGIELILSQFHLKQFHLKLDFFSIFLSLILIAASGFFMTIPLFWETFGPPAEQITLQIENQAREELQEALQDQLQIERLHLQTAGNYWTAAAIDTPENLPLRIQITFSGPYSDPQAFAQDCQRALKGISKTDLLADCIILENRQGSVYQLRLDEPFRLDFSLKQLCTMVTAEEN